jgi:hypothetical protein
MTTQPRINVWVHLEIMPTPDSDPIEGTVDSKIATCDMYNLFDVLVSAGVWSKDAGEMIADVEYLLSGGDDDDPDQG